MPAGFRKRPRNVRNQGRVRLRLRGPRLRCVANIKAPSSDEKKRQIQVSATPWPFVVGSWATSAHTEALPRGRPTLRTEDTRKLNASAT